VPLLLLVPVWVALLEMLVVADALMLAERDPVDVDVTVLGGDGVREELAVIEGEEDRVELSLALALDVGDTVALGLGVPVPLGLEEGVPLCELEGELVPERVPVPVPDGDAVFEEEPLSVILAVSLGVGDGLRLTLAELDGVFVSARSEGAGKKR